MGARARYAIVVAACALVALLGGPRSARALTFEQFTSLNMGGDDAPCWSQDGGYVYYSSRVDGFPHIWRKAADAPMNTSGTRLTTGFAPDELAVGISHDGNWAVMVIYDSLSSHHLWRCPSAGGAPLTKMTFGPFEYLDPEWSVGGKVAFCTTRGGAGYQIWTLSPNGTFPANELTAVTGPGFNDFHPSFSPDGNRIVFSSNRGGGQQLFVSTWNGSAWGAPAQLTNGSGDKSNPCWSPNGLHIAYQLSTSGHGADTAVWIIESDGSNARLATSGGAYDARPCWSPDGNSLAFVSDRSGANYIWLMQDVATPAASESWGRIKDRYRR